MYICDVLPGALANGGGPGDFFGAAEAGVVPIASRSDIRVSSNLAT